MIQHHGWSLTDLDNMMPYERTIYVTLLQQWIKAENERVRTENAKMRK
jgi:hypothetical protein